MPVSDLRETEEELLVRGLPLPFVAVEVVEAVDFLEEAARAGRFGGGDSVSVGDNDEVGDRSRLVVEVLRTIVSWAARLIEERERGRERARRVRCERMGMDM